MKGVSTTVGTRHASSLRRYRFLFGFLVLLAVLLPLYLSTLQTIPNGAEHYFMIDVGETQIVLNQWGTLHATGYPLYVMTGSTLVTLLRAVGVSTATAPALVSLLWGLLALGVVFGVQLSVFRWWLPVNKPSPQTPLPEGEGLQAVSDNLVPSTQPSALSPFNSEPGTRNSELNTQHSVLSTPYFFLPALLATILFGLTRTVWVHLVIAEIYSFGLLILALLLAVALWPNPSPHTERGTLRGRIYWLALIGGIGVFHHRALLMAAPALLYAVWPEVAARQQLPVASFQSKSPHPNPRSIRARGFKHIPTTRNSEPGTQNLKRVSVRLLLCLLIGLLGFLPYAYLPLRANAGAEWVYGQPNTWPGFWDQFFGREAERFIGAPGSLEALAANFNTVNAVLLTDLTAPGLLAGTAGLLLALRQPALRRAAVTLILSAATAYGFHIFLYTDILSALILPVTLSIAFGWAFLMQAVGSRRLAIGRKSSVISRQSSVVMVIAALIFGAVLVTRNFPFISQLTSDPTGLETIKLVGTAPPDSTVMLAWGPRYFAAGFAQDVQGRLRDIELVDHRADYTAVLRAGRLLVTPEYTFYNQAVSWWEGRLGARVYLNAVAPRLVRIKTQPEQAAAPPDGIAALSQQLTCTPDAIQVSAAWAAGQPPERDLSVFVHLLDAAGGLIAQGDQAAPVYGWRPLTTWAAGEIVRDVYTLPRPNEAASVRFGLYYQAASGEFVNEVEYELPVECE